MDAGQIVEQPGGWLDGHLAGWMGGKPQLGLGQAQERGTDAAQGEHFGGSLFGGLVLVPWGGSFVCMGFGDVLSRTNHSTERVFVSCG